MKLMMQYLTLLGILLVATAVLSLPLVAVVFFIVQLVKYFGV